mgnify:CR=1 FL=1
MEKIFHYHLIRRQVICCPLTLSAVYYVYLSLDSDCDGFPDRFVSGTADSDSDDDNEKPAPGAPEPEGRRGRGPVIPPKSNLAFKEDYVTE